MGSWKGLVTPSFLKSKLLLDDRELFKIQNLFSLLLDMPLFLTNSSSCMTIIEEMGNWVYCSKHIWKGEMMVHACNLRWIAYFYYSGQGVLKSCQPFLPAFRVRKLCQDLTLLLYLSKYVLARTPCILAVFCHFSPVEAFLQHLVPPLQRLRIDRERIRSVNKSEQIFNQAQVF